MDYPMYELGVKEGDWAEYDVLEAENYEFFTEIHSGDKLRFEVVGIEVQERMYPNGTVVFEVEAPVCEIFLNGEHIGNNVTLGEMIFCPKGEEHWKNLNKIEDVWKIEAPKYGTRYESNMTFGQGTSTSPTGWRAQSAAALSRSFINGKAYYIVYHFKSSGYHP
ncbi:MAG: hypothetical protein U9N07_00640 [Euryarchaeota archaeon]|nr:hypothetical protein [Euryarchaeota archaeon]